MASIRRRGLKWQVQVRRKHTSSFSQSFHTYKDAEEWARYMEVQADRRDLPADLGALKRITLKHLVERYRDTVSVNKRRYSIERYVLNQFLHHPICCKSLAELRTADFAAYRDQRLTEVKPASLKRELGPIHHMFGVARREWGLPLPNNPLDSLLIGGKDQPRERRLRPGELDQLKRSMELCRNPIIRPVVLFALETGMRRGEILSLTWDCVDLRNRALTVRAAKNGHARTIPLTRAAVEILEIVLSRRRPGISYNCQCLQIGLAASSRPSWPPGSALP